MSSTQTALEAAIDADPDDIAAWHALADLLIEDGDPRGDFMRVQIALEDESLSMEERRKLAEEEKQIFEANENQFIGEAIWSINSKESVEYWKLNFSPKDFHRGWLEAIGLRTLTEPIVSALLASPEFRWVKRLSIEHHDYESTITTDAIARAAFVPRLQSFTLGESEQYTHTNGEGIEKFVSAASNLESLTLHAHRIPTAGVLSTRLPKLKSLSINCTHEYDTRPLMTNESLCQLETIHLLPHMLEPGDDTPYLGIRQLSDIAESPHLKNLKRLTFVASNAGNEGCAVLVRTGILFRLQSLDLSYGTITEVGANALLTALRTRPNQLRSLDLSNNTISGLVLTALNAPTVAVKIGGQNSEEQRYFTVGDME